MEEDVVYYRNLKLLADRLKGGVVITCSCSANCDIVVMDRKDDLFSGEYTADIVVPIRNGDNVEGGKFACVRAFNQHNGICYYFRLDSRLSLKNCRGERIMDWREEFRYDQPF